MKILIIIILFLSIELQAQNNTLYFSFQPIDLGIGLRYDWQPKLIGYYTSLTRGNYMLHENYIKDHYRFSVGAIIDKFTIGLSYNKYGETRGTFPKRTLKPYSFEVGIRNFVNRFTCGIRFDPLKREASCDFGVKF